MCMGLTVLIRMTKKMPGACPFDGIQHCKETVIAVIVIMVIIVRVIIVVVVAVFVVAVVIIVIIVAIIAIVLIIVWWHKMTKAWLGNPVGIPENSREFLIPDPFSTQFFPIPVPVPIGKILPATARHIHAFFIR